MGRRLISACRAVHPPLVLGKRVDLGIHILQPLFALPVLQNLRQPTQAVQHKAGQLARLGAKVQAVVAAAAGSDQRDGNAHRQVGRQGDYAQQRMKTADKQAQKNGKQRGNGDRGNGMGVEHLQ